MKVALLLFGQPRNVDNPNSFKSHQKWIFDEYDVDTFCHVWWDKDVSEYDVSDWVSEQCIASGNPVEIIESLYKPKSIKVEAPRTFKLSDSLYEKTRQRFGYGHPWSEKTLSNVSSHLYSIEAAARLIKNPDDYDFIILSRYDNFIHNFPDLTSMSDEYFYISDHHPRFPDLMYIFGSRFIETQYTYGRMEMLADKYFHSFWEPSAECYKYHNFMNQCLPSELFPIEWPLNRIKSPSELFPVHLPVRVVRDNIGYGDTSNLPHEYLMNIQ